MKIGYYICNMKSEEIIEELRVHAGWEKIDAEELPDGIEPYEIPVYKTVKVSKEVPIPDLDAPVAEWHLLGKYDGKTIVMIQAEELPKKGYLGSSPAEIIKACIAGKIPAEAVAGHLYSTWAVDEKDADGNPITSCRGTMLEWMRAGEPKLLDRWWPPLQIQGVDIPMPLDADIEALVALAETQAAK